MYFYFFIFLFLTINSYMGALETGSVIEFILQGDFWVCRENWLSATNAENGGGRHDYFVWFGLVWFGFCFFFSPSFFLVD